jgi:hypothetical protein
MHGQLDNQLELKIYQQLRGHSTLGSSRLGALAAMFMSNWRNSAKFVSNSRNLSEVRTA